MFKYSIAAVVIISIVLKSSLAQMDMDAAAETIEYQNEFDEKGQYKFKFSTSNGIKRSEAGNLDSDGTLIVQGTYEYVDPDGRLYSVSFYADKTGYHPTIISKEQKHPSLTIEDNKPIFLQDLPIQTVSAPLPPSVVASLLG